MPQTATLRMRDVCARTGLARSTIHHYIREGLLPKPPKAGRNTAFYDEGFVQRARLVKALQAKTHMPLAAIRDTLDGMPKGAVDAIDPERFAGVTQRIANELRFASEQELARAELLEATGFKPTELDGLATARLVEPSPRGTYSPLDARIALAIARIRGAGATIERGFAGSAQIIGTYQRHLTEIARTEANEMVRMMGSLADIDVEAFVQHILEPLGDLVAALHRKALVQAVSELTNNGGNGGHSRR
jgi:DNA-binding transcriptional MerR regulator